MTNNDIGSLLFYKVVSKGMTSMMPKDVGWNGFLVIFAG